MIQTSTDRKRKTNEVYAQTVVILGRKDDPETDLRKEVMPDVLHEVECDNLSELVRDILDKKIIMRRRVS